MSIRLLVIALLSLTLVPLLSGCSATTYALQQRYVGEDKACVWQGTLQCPPYVLYLNQTQRQSLALHVSNNLIYDSTNALFDTTYADPTGITGRRAAIYVADANNLYASRQNKVYLFHHSSLLAGGPVYAAGEVQATAGVITLVTNCSGHYQPDADVTKAAIQTVLNAKGYKRDFAFQSCSKAEMENYFQKPSIDKSSN